MLTDIALHEEPFHTATGTAFADLVIDGHRETWPIRSKRFRAWLRRCHYQATGEAASAAEIRSALDLLEARAQFDGPQRAVHVRIAEQAGHIYLDLADEFWRAPTPSRTSTRMLIAVGSVTRSPSTPKACAAFAKSTSGLPL